MDRWPPRDPVLESELRLELELEVRLTQEELGTVSSAMPTAFADPLIRTWTAFGIRQAIATNVSPQVTGEYLAGQALGRLRPNPKSAHQALSATPPSSSVSSSVMMLGEAPRATGPPVRLVAGWADRPVQRARS